MLVAQPDWHPELMAKLGLNEENVGQLAQLLVDFHRQFAPCFHRSEQQAYGEVYLKGLTSDLENKSVESIALRYLDEHGVRGLQRFLTNSPWDHDLILALYQKRLTQLIAAPDGMVTVDSCEFPKKSRESVGVARQYCGHLGKVDNCQSGVFTGYTSSKGYGLIHRRLYIPEGWFSAKYQERREKCQVPSDLEFQTKAEIACTLLKEIAAPELRFSRWLSCDTAFSSNHGFLDTVAAQGYWYFVSVPAKTQVWREQPEVGVPPYKGRGPRPGKVTALTPSTAVSEIAQDPGLVWHTVTLTQGAKGPIQAEVTRLRVVDCRDGLPHQEVWLFLRRQADGKVKHFLSNAPQDTPWEEMIRVATMCWPIEQCFQEGKSHLGMDHYEFRSWPAWHRHMTYVFLAMLFLLEVRYTLKKIRPRLDPPPGQTPDGLRPGTAAPLPL